MAGILAAVEGAEDIAKQILPDKAAELQSQTQINIAQAQTNTAEASSSDKFTSRARPAILYACIPPIVIFYTIIPLVNWIFSWFGRHIDPPQFDMNFLNQLVLGSLGIYGSLRTVEKVMKK